MRSWPVRRLDGHGPPPAEVCEAVAEFFDGPCKPADFDALEMEDCDEPDMDGGCEPCDGGDGCGNYMEEDECKSEGCTWMGSDGPGCGGDDDHDGHDHDDRIRRLSGHSGYGYGYGMVVDDDHDDDHDDDDEDDHDGHDHDD